MALQDTYSSIHRRNAGPGQSVDGNASNGRSAVATSEIQYGGAVQLGDGSTVAPLSTGGVFAGIAAAGRLSAPGVGTYQQTDNVPIANSGRWWGLADKALAAGVRLNWNSTTLRWTDQATSGTIIATPGVEADEAANGSGHEIPIRIKRTRN